MRVVRGGNRSVVRYFFLCFFLYAGVGHAQKESYPQGYFALPVYPGQANTLSGALGDLRSNHFHAGIDVRTQRREGLPITAAAEGYISRIAVQRAGYGKVLYIRHPNGMTTVYAHLQKFNKEIGDYVRAEQYKNQTFEISLTPEEGRFRVKKGELVAISGNTGSSEGPHLHFEIRDSRDNCLNPLFFGFPEIKDTTPPRFVNIALTPLSIDSRVNGRIDRQVFAPVPQKGGRVLSLKDTVRAIGEIGLELQAFDRMDGTGFNYGLNCIEVRVDGKEIFVFNMEKFPVGAGRDYNYLINYKARVKDRERYYKCYHPGGEAFDMYKTDEHRGKLVVGDASVHLVQVRIFDSYENWSELKFIVKGEKEAGTPVQNEEEERVPGIFSETLGDLVKLSAGESSATFYTRGVARTVPAVYTEKGRYIFLAALQKRLPDSVEVGRQVYRFGFADKIPPGKPYEYAREDLRISFGERSLFDTLYLHIVTTGNTLQINEYTEPLRGEIEVTYQPSVDESLKEKTKIYRLVNGKDSFVGGSWSDSGIRFNTRELGTFYPLTDTVPPSVRLLESSPRLVRARISDSLSGISSFRARVNGEWILMNYEYKNNYIWSEKADETRGFEGELELEVTDRAGNVTIVNAKIAEPQRSGGKRP